MNFQPFTSCIWKNEVTIPGFQEVPYLLRINFNYIINNIKDKLFWKKSQSTAESAWVPVMKEE